VLKNSLTRTPLHLRCLRVAGYLVCGRGLVRANQNILTPCCPYDLTVGDFNRDGLADIAVPMTGSQGDGAVALLLGKAGGSFEMSSTLPAGPNPWTAATGDFNKDGNPDLA
jgi:hypothetical protein